MTNPRDFSEEQLRVDCRWEAFRGSGPGGQKRNKTSSAVRVVHVPTGLSATAGEFRSQQQNKRNALRRLRHRMAIELREPINGPVMIPASLAHYFSQGKLRCGLRDESYPSVLGLVLDVLLATGGEVGASAAKLGITTANLVSFLQEDHDALSTVNQARKIAGHRALGG